LSDAHSYACLSSEATERAGVSFMKRPTPRWLKSAIFYEIYPQSFRDSNGDGIGDIPGIIEKLDYIAALGCTAIWLNPCFASPFGDAGYDVADFYRVAPRYGTNDDLVRLFREAKARRIRVCLDFVAGHTSIEHPWFKESCRHEPNRYSNWYIWTQSIWDKGDPKKPMVHGHAERDGNYLANFFYFQPALNYGYAQPEYSWQLPVDHPDVLAVRQEMKNILRYWLDQGADGFRVDMAMSLVKNDPDLRETMRLWADIREMFDQDYPDAVLMSEWSDPAKAILAGFHVDFMLAFGNPPAYTSLLRKEPGRDLNPQADKEGHSYFDHCGLGDIREFLAPYLEHYDVTKDYGYITIPTGNHDVPRLALGRTDKEILVVFALVLTMPGIPFIYYGDEIGMRHMQGLTSKEGGYSRTGARTPMQWDDSANLGFSAASPGDLYLPVDSKPDAPTVASQHEKLLSKVRSLVHLRRSWAALGNDGAFRPLASEGYPFVYQRGTGSDAFVVMINPADSCQPASFLLPQVGALQQIHGDHIDVLADRDRYSLIMPPVSYAVFKIT